MTFFVMGCVPSLTKEQKKAYIVGYSNIETYLCTLMGEEENQSLAYEPITLIRQEMK